MEYRMKPNVTCPFEPILRFGFCKFLETVSNGFQRSLTVSNDFCPSGVRLSPCGNYRKLQENAGNYREPRETNGELLETAGNPRKPLGMRHLISNELIIHWMNHDP